MRIKSLLTLAALAAWSVMLLAACQPAADDRSPVELAEARWGHLVEREFGEAWEYYSPGFREQMSRESYVETMSRRPIRWIEAEALGEECEGDRCTVSVRVHYRATGAPMGQSQAEMNRTLTETWIRLEGRWWYASN